MAVSKTSRYVVKLVSPDGAHHRMFFCEAADEDDARDLADKNAAELATAQADTLDDKVAARKYVRANTYTVDSVNRE